MNERFVSWRAAEGPKARTHGGMPHSLWLLPCYWHGVCRGATPPNITRRAEQLPMASPSCPVARAQMANYRRVPGQGRCKWRSSRSSVRPRPRKMDGQRMPRGCLLIFAPIENCRLPSKSKLHVGFGQ